MRNPRHLALLPAFLLLSQSAPVPIEGQLGQVAPQSADVRLPDTLVHEDTTGSTNQTLLALAGSDGGGFGVVWRDQRDGMLGLYLARFDAHGTLREPERPIHQPHTARRKEPALALAKDGAGAVLWTSDYQGEPVPWIHSFAASGAWSSEDRNLTALPDGSRALLTRDSGVRLPVATALAQGGYAVAWTQGGAVFYFETGADGVPKSEPQRSSPKDHKVEAGVFLAQSRKQGALLAWRANERLWAQNAARPKATPADLGIGELVRLVSDPEGGFWALVKNGDAHALRHLAADGRADRPETSVLASGQSALDLAPFDGGLALLAQTGGAAPSANARNAGRGDRGGGRVAGGGGEGASYTLVLLDTSARASPTAPLAITSPDTKLVGAPQIASDGPSLFVAWTDMRSGDPDVWGRLIHPIRGAVGKEGHNFTPELEPERRLNTDVASSDQSSPGIAGNGEHGVITWQDKRDNAGRIYARRFGLPAALNGHEFRVPDPAKGADETGERPVCAVRADASFLVVWHGLGQPRLRAQAFDADAHAVAAPSTIAETAAGACVIALPEDHGYVAVWTQAEPSGVFARRVDPSGAPQGEAQRLSREGTLARDNPSCALLDDGRLIVAWDQHEDGSNWNLRARFADREGRGSGEEFALEPSPRHQDWDPYVAPAANDGFLVAWTAGAPDDGTRDVVARLYDRDGRSAGALLPISPLKNEQDNPQCLRLADKSYVVAWEDDISNLDHTYLRRITRNGRELGPIVRMNELPTKACEDRVAPQIAVLGDGLAGTWGDRRRSQGWDVFLRLLGPRFDEVGKR